MLPNEKGKIAVLVIDMLNDFVKPGAILEVPAARNIIDNIKKLIQVAHEKRIPVIYVCDSHRKGDKEFEAWPPHALEGTHGAEVIEELAPQRGDIIVRKRRYSGFFETDLDLTLRELKIQTLILTGILTDICVFFTAVDAFYRGYEIYIVSDGTASIDEKRHNDALEKLRMLARAKVVKTEEAINLLKKV